MIYLAQFVSFWPLASNKWLFITLLLYLLIYLGNVSYLVPITGMVSLCFDLCNHVSSYFSRTKLFIQLGIVTITSFLLLFSPFLRPPELLIAVITRIFPFARGLFEDKVANFWCASNVVIKWKNYFQPSTLPKLATLLTATSFLPSMVALILPGLKATVVAAPTERPATLSLLPYALFQSSLSFFLFSFQVHEKSILIPLLPITLLLAATNPGPGSSSVWEWGVLINNVACFRFVSFSIGLC